MAMSPLYGLVTICICGIASALTLSGSCPSIQTMPHFNLEKFCERWYVSYAYPEKYPPYIKCLRVDCIRESWERDLFRLQVTAENVLMEGTEYLRLEVPDIYKPEQLAMQLRSLGYERDFWILETDYEEFVLAYSCRDTASSSDQYAWILTREEHPSNDVVKRACQAAKDHYLDLQSLKAIDGTNCLVLME